jgi:2-hydroxychromene-2-carboxylate isomerase
VNVGDVIELASRRADRSRAIPGEPVVFYVELGNPFSYLAAEQVERELGEIPWIPVSSFGPLSAEDRAAAERTAAELRLPLVWPDAIEGGFPRAHRAAAAAAERGKAAEFMLAAMRLAFCGGFDLDDPETLVEAAAAADMAPESCLAAVVDSRLEAMLDATAAGLRRRGVSELPALRVGPAWRYGVAAVEETRIIAAVARAARGR